MRHQDSPEIELRTPPLGHPGLAYGPQSIQYNKDGWREELSQRLMKYQKSYNDLIAKDLKEFNKMLNEKGVLTINAMK